MTKLSDTQALILSTAAQRPEHIALPLPDSLRGGAAAKVVGAMLAKGFLEEVDADTRKGEPVWRESGDGHGVTLVATDAGPQGTHPVDRRRQRKVRRRLALRLVDRPLLDDAVVQHEFSGQ
ncbi:hypothetical protein [uncultured Paracoccus sp.]|uniref:hypothetical protein n=1 Tax=Paracoccus sp. S1E-3 TaxID=2756130 RepID=UPI00344F1820